MKLKIAALAIIGVASLCGAAESATTAAQPAAQQTTVTVAAQPAAAQPAAAQPAAAQPVQREVPGIGSCLARGFCNVLTGWLEIPRCMVYDNSVIPFIGLIVGIPEGAFYTVARELAGVVDIVAFGCTGYGMHNEIFGYTVFHSNWTPPKK